MEHGTPATLWCVHSHTSAPTTCADSGTELQLPYGRHLGTSRERSDRGMMGETRQQGRSANRHVSRLRHTPILRCQCPRALPLLGEHAVRAVSCVLLGTDQTIGWLVSASGTERDTRRVNESGEVRATRVHGERGCERVLASSPVRGTKDAMPGGLARHLQVVRVRCECECM